MTATPAPWRTLVSAGQLRERLADGADVALLDCGFDLADTAAGERAFAQGHLPGALYAHLDRDLCGAKTGRNGRHPLPERAAFAARVGAWGIGPRTLVVAYDAQGGVYAARAWWMLRWLGHEAAAVLDGGSAAWLAQGGVLETRPGARTPGPAYPASASAPGTPLAPSIEVEALQEAMARGEAIVIDARAPERFRGDIEPLDPVAGHIPGALNRFFKDNLGAGGCFKSPGVLAAEFAALGAAAARRGPASVVHQCGSGVTACHNLLAMAHAGLHGSALYPGSWSEWCADPRRPVARG
ncbi:MAG: sulfurtransferase [Rubrivivax sp.]|nr:sulfurtransferase [Rubrivivax sp.]